VPTVVFPGVINVQLPTAELYPALPPPVSVIGTVLGPGDAPVEAEVEFEGLAFSNGVTLSPDFEFTTTARARVSGGASSYSVTLPQGEYRVTVRPVSDGDPDGEAGPPPALYVTTFTANDRTTVMPYPLPAMRTISGTAVTADDRALVGATVEAIPVSCDLSSSPAADAGDGGTSLKQLGSTAACLPRPQQTVVTDPVAGSFSVRLDPGSYRLRVRPAEGTGFPWVTQDLVPSAAGTVRVIVPAPFHASFRLLDGNDVPVARALVRAFLVPDTSSSAPAVELGETLTDGSGQCDLYLNLAPPP
jgi:hypothetical protein